MSDLVLYPIRGQVSQVIGKSEYIVYVPRATKYAYGTVKIGDGLNISDGVISLDRTEIPIKIVAVEGVDLIADDAKRVNVTKLALGLDKVNNTSDAEKPVSTAVREALDILEVNVTDDIMDVQEKLDDYKLVVNDKFTQAEESVNNRLIVVNDTISQNKIELQQSISRLEDIVAGTDQAVAYANYQEVVDTFNFAATNAYKVGQTVFVQDTNVPDLWVYSVENTHVDFEYVGDEDIVETLITDGTIQFGYYKLAMMETKTTDVENMVTLDTIQTITGTKIFTEQIGILNGSDGDINYIKHINNNFLVSSSDGDSIINIDEQLKKFHFYNKPIALEEYVDDNFISYTTEQNLTPEQQEIARNNIGAGTGGGASVDYATTEEAGIILIATDSDIEAGVDTTKAVTPAQLNAVVGGVENWLVELNTGAGV